MSGLGAHGPFDLTFPLLPFPSPQVGGASLKGPSFIKICNSEHKHS